jgi:archaeosine-15-forming tRNA-guanine transglycosylase
MNGKELNEEIARRYDVPMGSLQKTINRATRTLPGGDETLDALESLNAARIHANRHKADERVIATDAAIDRVEEIRSAMRERIIASCNTPDEIYVVCNNDDMLSATQDETLAKAEVERLRPTAGDRDYYHYHEVRFLRGERNGRG